MGRQQIEGPSTPTGRVIGRHNDSVYDVAPARDGEAVVSTGRDGAVRLWSMVADRLERDWTVDGPATSITIAGDSAATCTRAGSIFVLSLESDDFAARWDCPQPEAVLFLDDGAILLSAGGDGLVRWWEVSTGREVARVAVDPPAAVVRLRPSPDGTTVAASTQSAGIVFIDAAAARVDRTVIPDYGSTVHVTDCIYLDDDTCAACLHVRHQGQIGTTEDPDLYEILVWQPANEPPRTDTTLLGHTNWIASLAVSAHGDLLASASMDATVGIWSPPQCRGFLRGHGDTVYGTCFLPDDDLVTSSADGTLRVWTLLDDLELVPAALPFSFDELVASSAQTRVTDPVHVLAREVAEALIAQETPAALAAAAAQLVEVNSPFWLATLRAVNQTVTVLREQAQRSGDAVTALRCARVDATVQEVIKRSMLASRPSLDAEPDYDIPERPSRRADDIVAAFTRAVSAGDTSALAARVEGRAIPAEELLPALGQIDQDFWPRVVSGRIDAQIVAPAARVLAAASTDHDATRLYLCDVTGRLLGIAQWNDDAIEVLQRGVETARAIGSERDEASLLGNLANAYRNAGRLTEAERAYEQLIDLAPPNEILANHLSNLALVYSDRGQTGRAAARTEDALAVATNTDDESLRTQIEVNLGGYYHQLGEDERAVPLLEASVERAQRIGHTRLHAQALTNLAQCLGSLGQLERAGDSYRHAIEVARAIGDPSQLVHGLAGLGDVARNRGARDEAARRYREAADVAGANRLGRRQFRALAALASVLDDEAAGPVLEEAAALGEEARLSVVGGTLGPALRDVHRRLIRLAADDDPAAAFAWAERSRIALLADLGAAPLDAAAVGRALRRVSDSARLVSWFDGGTSLYVFVVAADGAVHAAALPLDGELDRATRLAQRELAGHGVGETWDEPLAVAVGAALPYLENADIVVFAPHGRLVNLPLHALRYDGGRLIERWPIAYVPAASALPGLLDAADPPTSPGVVGALFVHEAERVAAILGVDTTLVGTTVEKDDVLSLLRTRDLVHVSSHGFFSPNEPAFSGWILDPSSDVLDYLRARLKRSFERPYEDVLAVARHEDEARAAILSADDIVRATLRVRHATMSACESGVVAVGPSDDPAGLVPALLGGGVRSILAALWRVEPDATEELMIRFYERIWADGGWTRRPQILRDLILDAMRERPDDIENWGAFVLVGGLVDRTS